MIEKIVTKKKNISFLPHLIRKNVFFEINGYPEIGFGEDQLYAIKINEYCEKHNKKIELVENAFFSGHGVHSLKELYEQGYWYGKTGVLYINKSGEGKLRAFISVYLRAIHFASFAFGLFFFVNPNFLIFLIPFAIVTMTKILKAFREKNVFVAMQTLTYLVSGAALAHGLFFYLTGLDKKIGR